MDELLSTLSGHGFSIPQIKLNGEIIRFDRSGKSNAWFVGFEVKSKKGEIYIVANYGDWKTGEKHEWRTERKYTKLENVEIYRKLRESQKEFGRQRKKIQEDTKREAQDKWNDARSNNKVDYLKKKLVSSLFGCRSILGNNGRVLLVPMRDCHGELWGFQTIHPGGSKYFLSGQRIDGLFHTIHSDESNTNPLENADKILIAEGFSTASSIHQATLLPVVCAFNAQNLPKVAKELKDFYPTASFIICGDDDQFNETSNVGRKYAEKAANVCAGACVFPSFSSLASKPTDFNDLHCLEGLEIVKNQILGIKEAEKQYILCLGFEKDKYFYMSSENKCINELPSTGHTKLQLLNFLPLNYWMTSYPADNSEGVNWTLAANDLMERCRKKGLFNLNNVRSSGAWLEDKNKLILNRGNMLIENGEELGFHSIRSKYIYEPGHHILPKPSKNFLTDFECEEFLETLNLLSWAQKDYYKFLAGWLMTAPVCGALSWRSHIWLSGPSGSGKSTIMNEIINKFLQKNALFLQGASTEAGIRQSLGKKALPLIFDEFETHDKKSGQRINQIIELIRQASCETDAYIIKGSSDGTSISYLPRFAAFVSSVNVNLNFEADKNRFTVIELLRQSGDKEESLRKFKNFQARMDLIDERWVHGFYSRIFGLWDVFIKNRSFLYDIISKRYNARFAQQYGTLLAGYAICESSKPLSMDHAKFLVDTTDLEIKIQESNENDETECLNYLMRKKIHVNGSINQDLTMFELIQGVRGESEIGGSRREWESILKRYGVLVKDDELLISNNHAEINEIYKDTKWSGLYDRSLKRIPGAGNNKNKPIWISGAVNKCTNIPISTLFLT